MERYKSEGGISGRADRAAEGDRVAAHCGLTNQREGLQKIKRCSVFIKKCVINKHNYYYCCYIL